MGGAGGGSGGPAGGGSSRPRTSLIAQLENPMTTVLQTVRQVELHIQMQNENGRDGVESSTAMIRRAGAYISQASKGMYKSFAEGQQAIMLSPQLNGIKLSPNLEKFLRSESYVNNFAGLMASVRSNKFETPAMAKQAAACMNGMMRDPSLFTFGDNVMTFVGDTKLHDAAWRMALAAAFTVLRTKFKMKAVHFSNMGTSILFVCVCVCVCVCLCVCVCAN